MYFGEEPQEPLAFQSSPVIGGVLMLTALIMIMGTINLFGIEGAAEAAAITLVR